MRDGRAVWLTTVDNPFDPFTQWKRWYDFDRDCGYNTCQKIASIAETSENLTDAEYENAVVNAMMTLINFYAPYEVYRLAIEGSCQTWGPSRA